MSDRIVGQSMAVFGKPYRVAVNTSHKKRYCNLCEKEKNTSLFYYPDGEESQLICESCYRELYLNTRKILMKAKETLPVGTTIINGGKISCCISCKGMLEKQYYRIINSGKHPLTIACLYKCVACGRLFTVANNYDPNMFGNYNVVIAKGETKNKQNNLTLTERAPQSVASPYRSIEVTEFLTRASLKRCSSNNHIIEDIQAGVKVLHKDYSVTVELVPAFYCKTCKKYYLLESDYLKLDDSGILLCNVVEQRYWNTHGKGNGFYYITNQESLLHKMGYNVSASNGLSHNARAAILRAALENGLLSKADILSHLDYLIQRSINSATLSTAVEKWKQDREYVQSLSKHNSRVYINANTIVHNSSTGKKKKQSMNLDKKKGKKRF